MNKEAKIYVAGHRGLVGSAIVKNLQQKGYLNILTKTHQEVDLTNQQETADFFAIEKPEYVFLAAAKVGGILANNNFRADFIYENLMIQNNVIHQSYAHKVKKLLFLGSTCIYPKNANQPIKETEILTNVLEYTNEPYAIAKIAGIKLCESYNLQYETNFLSVMPTNLYGPRDNYHPENSHVIPGMIYRFHEAKIKNLDEVLLWGTGEPLREFLHVDDLAEAIFDVLKSNELLFDYYNIGSGEEISIKDLGLLIKQVGWVDSHTRQKIH